MIHSHTILEYNIFLGIHIHRNRTLHYIIFILLLKRKKYMSKKYCDNEKSYDYRILETQSVKMMLKINK